MVQQRDVPGIDAAYLAMDTDEGMEVVWNEVRLEHTTIVYFTAYILHTNIHDLYNNRLRPCIPLCIRHAYIHCIQVCMKLHTTID
ncbi:Nuclear receptor-binding protein 2 [Halocaridina rubra]|uniref:Nuclear receptor-binding protein 2 n=1 Tax=Halocaridina rubra TaxID=373956 RepID=A0AAN8X408_HALRR